MKSKVKPKKKLRIKSNNKYYTLKDSPFFKLTTKKRLVDILGKPIGDLEALSSSSNYRVFLLENERKKREIQAPTLNLDIIQTRIASLLVRIQTPAYLHSGIKGRSNISNAKIHVGNHPVLTMDIQKFYPSVTKKSIFNFFYSTMSTSSDVAGILAELCTYNNHIPTGSRLSMPLSFWSNLSMYSRINSYCQNKDVNFTLFVDDLTFSGNNINKLFLRHIERIISDAGLIVHPKKTKLYTRSQPKLITGVVLQGGTIRLRNKHHKSIYTLFSDMPRCEDDEQLETIQKELIGRLSAAGQIEKEFKIKASQIRKQING